MIDFVRHRVLFFVISAVLIVPGLVSLALPDGINPGIDFTSGSILTLQFEHPVEQGDLREALGSIGHPEAIVQRSDNVYLVRTFPLAGEVRDFAGEIVRPSERQTIEQALEARFGTVDVLGFDSVSPLVAAEIVQKSVLGVIVACGGILLYLWWAFRKVKDSWRYGACAVFALVHDALLLLGIFSLLGRFSHVELDALFITASLTVIGFSVHDTIVVFDRIRENLQRFAGESFETVVNHSLTQTLGRSLSTSITSLLVMVALLLFGGVTMRPFVLALVIGIVSGTYSSIFNASMLLVVWQNGELARLFGRQPPAPETVRAPA
ncbi:MAG TPA: protein translocase subunit SecF [Chloroflexota bacterium]|jgi:preprotein translocase subunit SecF